MPGASSSRTHHRAPRQFGASWPSGSAKHLRDADTSTPESSMMRRPGYLIAAVAFAAIVAAFWYLILSPGWIARTGWERSEVEVTD